MNMLIVLVVLIVFCLLWWGNATYQENLMKADYLSTYGKEKFIEKFGQKDFEKLSGKKA
jgi:hypothetical protein